MSAEDEVTILRRLAIFQLLTGEQLRLLVFGADKLILERGQHLFHQDETAKSAFVVLSGRIDLIRTIDGKNVVVESVDSGCLIGELALICETKRAVSAIAADETVLLQIKRLKFQRLLREFPQIAYGLHAYLRNNMHRFINNLHRQLPPLDEE